MLCSVASLFLISTVCPTRAPCTRGWYTQPCCSMTAEAGDAAACGNEPLTLTNTLISAPSAALTTVCCTTRFPALILRQLGSAPILITAFGGGVPVSFTCPSIVPPDCAETLRSGPAARVAITVPIIGSHTRFMTNLQAAAFGCALSSTDR